MKKRTLASYSRDELETMLGTLCTALREIDSDQILEELEADDDSEDTGEDVADRFEEEINKALMDPDLAEWLVAFVNGQMVSSELERARQEANKAIRWYRQLKAAQEEADESEDEFQIDDDDDERPVPDDGDTIIVYDKARRRFRRSNGTIYGDKGLWGNRLEKGIPSTPTRKLVWDEELDGWIFPEDVRRAKLAGYLRDER